MDEVIQSDEYQAAKIALPPRTSDMAGLLYREYKEIKEEAILEVFGWDSDNKKFVDNNSQFPIIGQAIQMKKQLMGDGLPTNNLFGD